MAVFQSSSDRSYITYRRSTFGGDWQSIGYYDHIDSYRSTSKQSLKTVLREKGFIPPLPYIHAKNVGTIDPITVTLTQRLPRYNPGVTVNQFLVPLGKDEPNTYGIDGSYAKPRMANADSRALGALYQRAADKRVGLGEASAEVSKTVEMFFSVASRVCSAMRDVRKGRFARAAGTLGIPTPSFRHLTKKQMKNTASVWLEYRYGWTPLYSDLFGALTLAYDFARTHDPIYHIYGQFEDKYTRRLYDRVMPDSDVLCRPVYTDVIQVTNRVRYDAWFSMTNKTARAMTSLGVANPLSLAWELIPLSFVVDWFSNVGSCLEALSAFNGKRVESVSKTRFSYVVYDRTVTRVSTSLDPSSSSITFLGGSGNRKAMSIERKVLDSVPLLTPRVQVDLNPKRMTDALALVTQAFKR